jgi:YVTN family beta-propeller protein
VRPRSVQQQKPGRFRRFLRSPPGKALLIAVAIGIVVGSMVYVEELIAILAMLVGGLALPIYAGLKRPRYLALSGLVILLLSAPLGAIGFTQEVRSPTPAGSSDPSIASGQGPIALAADTATGEVYAANYAANTVSVFNASQNDLTATVDVGGLPDAVAVDTADHAAFVANLLSGNVSVVNTTTHRVAASVAVGSSPIAIAFDPANDRVYVANFDSNTVSVLWAANHTLAATVSVGTSPGALAVDPSVGKLFVANRGGSSVTAIYTSNDSLAATVTVRSTPWALLANANGSDLYVANAGSADVSILAAGNDSLLATVPVLASPQALALSSNGRTVYVADFAAANVSTINTSTLTAGTGIPVGTTPLGLAVDGATGQLWVVNSGSDNATVIDEASGASVASIATSYDPTSIVGPVSGDLYVGAYAGQAVDVLDGASRLLSTSFGDGSNGAILQNADVAPFTGSTSTNFTWTVTVEPAFAPTNTTGVRSVTLYVSTCPGATSNSSPFCPSGYAFINRTHTFSTPIIAPTNVTFVLTLGSDNVWSWQMGVALGSATPPLAYTPIAGGASTYVFLQGYGSSDGLEGPVVGTFADTYLLLLPTIFETTFLYLGVPFYLALAVYAYLKRRERIRRAASRRAAGEAGAAAAPTAPAAGGGAPSTGPASPTEAASAPTPPPEHERSCPSCSAVVYAGEPKCWKCGAVLPGEPGAPLPSGGGPSPPKPS